MVAIKSAEAESLLNSAKGRIDAFLVHGADAGQVSELAKAIAQRLSALAQPAGEIIRLSDQDLAQTPGRLASEARSLPMFGGRPVILVKQTPQLAPAVIEDLLNGPPLAAFIVIEAGNLKGDAKIRQLFEKAKTAAAIACYPAEGRSLIQQIRAEIERAGMRIEPAALQQLGELLGADWAVSKSELAKLILYARGEPEIKLAHVEAIVGDASAHAFDAAIGAAFAGDAAAALSQLDGLAERGTPPVVLLGVMINHLQKLHLILAGMDRGESFDNAAARIKPPVHFRQKDALKAQCRLWRLGEVSAAVELGQNVLRQTRLHPSLDRELVSDFLLRLCNRRTGENGSA